MKNEKYTVRCHNGIDLNHQTEVMSREAAERLVASIEKKQTCTLPHTIHLVKDNTTHHIVRGVCAYCRLPVSQLPDEPTQVMCLAKET